MDEWAVNSQVLNQMKEELDQVKSEVREFQKATLWTVQMAKQMGYSNEKLVEIMKANHADLEKEVPEFAAL
jgi:hypothetical protein